MHQVTINATLAVETAGLHTPCREAPLTMIPCMQRPVLPRMAEQLVFPTELSGTDLTRVIDNPLLVRSTSPAYFIFRAIQHDQTDGS